MPENAQPNKVGVGSSAAPKQSPNVSLPLTPSQVPAPERTATESLLTLNVTSSLPLISTWGEVPPPVSRVVTLVCTGSRLVPRSQAYFLTAADQGHFLLEPQTCCSLSLFESRCPSSRLGPILSCLVMLWFLACLACLVWSNIERAVPALFSSKVKVLCHMLVFQT